MRIMIYSIYDTATKAFMRPFFMQADGQALRAFSDIANDAEHDIGKHPEHYTLYRIGTFDDNNAKIIPENPESIATAMECIQTAQKINPGELIEFDKQAGNTTQ